ncbi:MULTISPECIES: hypothetical protein [Mumia]|uniref:hypothetical protein n=1 Tax=Mumia TaxID=1546255 RepID=UPI001AB04676|nr:MULTISPECIES: hypothetical protein [unclassified Mumia]
MTRAALLASAGIALLAGLDAALMLLDLPAPVQIDRLPVVHGMLMVLGFVGTLIALERAVALRRSLGVVAPALLGLGALVLLSPAPLVVGQGLLAAGSAALVGLYLPLWRRQRDDAVLVQALGAVLALGSAVLWLGGAALPVLAPWLVGFVVLTIAGERLELARIAMGPWAGSMLVLLASGLVTAVMAALLWPRPGTALLGAGLIALTGWLAAHDVARRTIHTAGLTRYMAGCMLAGYCWLGVAGAIWLLGGPALEGVRYDAVLHAVFLGFTLSMVMAHAPVILPAVLRRPLPYHPALIVPATLLHASLVLRLWVGDALGSHGAWVTGGVLNIVAVLSFLAVAIGCTVRGGRSPAGAAVMSRPW